MEHAQLCACCLRVGVQVYADVCMFAMRIVQLRVVSSDYAFMHAVLDTLSQGTLKFLGLKSKFWVFVDCNNTTVIKTSI